jgi:GT2 family glycosyltransferase
MRVSVVVPTFRRPELLSRCLTALVAQDLDAVEFEILVADDAADEDTRFQVRTFAESTRLAIVYVPVSGQHGPAAARNAGWRAAGADIFAFTDDDCVPQPGWLAAGLKALDADSTHAAVAGQVKVPLLAQPTDYERDTAGLASAQFVTASCFCRRWALEAVGGFDERFRAAWREDSDLQFTLLEAGFRSGRSPTAVVVHPLRPAPWGVSLRQQRKVVYDALLYKKHPNLYRQQIRRWPRWDYYATVAALAAAGCLGVAGLAMPSLVAAGLWAILMGQFVVRRLRGATRRPSRVAEMVITSALIPTLASFWRIYGAVKFRVAFF